jgi:hypothetical protein
MLIKFGFYEALMTETVAHCSIFLPTMPNGGPPEIRHYSFAGFTSGDAITFLQLAKIKSYFLKLWH